MAVNHDYDCDSCQSIFEAITEVEQRIVDCPVCKVGKAKRIYRRFGGMLGRNKGVFPYFDVQLGATVESSQHRDSIAKQRGLVVMGKEEFDRSRNAPRTPSPLQSDEPTPEFIEQAKRDWDDVRFGRVPPQVEEKRVADIAADVLNVNDYKPA